MMSLTQILSDLKFFLIVMALFMLMFGNVFLVLLPREEESSDEDDAPPFGTELETLLTLFRMMLGDFERSWFSANSDEISSVAVCAFVLYEFLITVLLLNMLIAVVSDSYDYAQIRAAKLFLRTRVELAAELVRPRPPPGPRGPHGAPLVRPPADAASSSRGNARRPCGGVSENDHVPKPSHGNAAD